MVQESLPTLDVMAIALLGVAVFEACILRLFIFTHTARRLDLSLSAQVFRHLMRLPLAYFESRRVETQSHEYRNSNRSDSFSPVLR